MTKEDLIEILHQLPNGLPVKLRSQDGGLIDINNVETDTERDRYDGDFDQQVITIY